MSADLRGALLDDADLDEAFLVGAQLEGADLRSARLENARLRSCRFDETTRWPEAFDPWERGAGPSEDLERRMRQWMSSGLSTPKNTPDGTDTRSSCSARPGFSTATRLSRGGCAGWGRSWPPPALLAECQREFPLDREPVDRTTRAGIITTLAACAVVLGLTARPAPAIPAGSTRPSPAAAPGCTAAGSWIARGSMKVRAVFAGTVAVPDGRILVISGSTDDGLPLLRRRRAVAGERRRLAVAARGAGSGAGVTDLLPGGHADRDAACLGAGRGHVAGRGWAVVEADPAWGSGLCTVRPDQVLRVLRRATIPVKTWRMRTGAG